MPTTGTSNRINGTIRQTAVTLLRRTGLLPAAERVRYLMTTARFARRNRTFRRQHPELAVPPAHLAYDAYGNINYDSYFVKGEAGARFISALARQYFSEQPIRVCDWGCGPARIVRHLPSLLVSGSTVFGTDYNAETIEWCSSHVPGVQFRVNTLAPPLPFSNAELDFLYCVSVFTHLSESMHEEWIAECRRVIKPGGLFVLTLHGDRCSRGLNQRERRLYEDGRVVVRGQVLEGSRTFVAYHSPAYVRQTLLRAFTDVRRDDRAPRSFAGDQDVYLARR